MRSPTKKRAIRALRDRGWRNALAITLTLVLVAWSRLPLGDDWAPLIGEAQVSTAR